MPQKLTEVELDEVSLVDRPANQHAKIVLMKRDDACKGEECVEKAPAGIQFNIGFKDEGGSEIQSVVFDSDKWDEEKAKAWLKDHDMEHGKMDKTTNTLRFRQQDPEGYSRFRMVTPGAQVSKALKAKDSWSNLQQTVDRALREKFQSATESNEMPSTSGYIFVRELFGDAVVFEQDGKIFRTDYEIDYDDTDAPTVTFSERVPQQVIYQDLSKQEPEKPTIPAELLFKLGQLQANVSLLTHRVNKFN